MCRLIATALLTLLVVLSACSGSDGRNREAARIGEGTQGISDTRESTRYAEGTDGPAGKTAGILAEELSGEQVNMAAQGASAPESDFNANAPQTVLDYLQFIIQNNDQIWTQYFLNNGLQEPLVSYHIVMPGETYTSNCTLPGGGGQLTVAHDTPNAFYCPDDQPNPGYTGTIYLPVTTMTKMWSGDIFGRQSQQIGDFAAAILTAHEFGHHVVDEMRIQYTQQHGVLYQAPTGKYNELIADCMAGAWAASAYYQGILDEQADWDEAATALEAIGDYDILSEGHHGTPAERVEALRTGYFGVPGATEPGAPAACIGKYWVVSS